MPHFLMISFVDLKFWIDNYGTISILLGAFIGVATKGRRFIKNAARSIMLGNSFHATFGDNPAETIKALNEAVQNAHDVLEIRQQISERYLKIGIYICETNGKCVWSNDRLRELFGLDSEEMKGAGWLLAIHTDDRKRVHESWMYAITENISYSERYTICNQRSKVGYFVATNAVAVIDDNGVIKCYVGYLIELDGQGKDCCFLEDKNENHKRH